MAGPWRVRFCTKENETVPDGMVWRFLLDGDGNPAGVMTVCPMCGGRGAAMFRGKREVYFPGQPHGPEWDWNGDADTPTLSPSVLSREPSCGMHVWVRDGWIIDAGTPPHGTRGGD
jgi:hypothetical protein